MDYKETIKEKLNSLSPDLRAFVLDENWRRESEKIGKQFNFDEEKYASFENEIFLVLLCLEPKTDFTENITRELEIDSNMAGWVKEEVDKNIFSKVTNEIDAVWQNAEIEASDFASPYSRATPDKKEAPNNIGQSFEQIILNQAKAMQPARNALASEAGGPARPAGEVPHNLPTTSEQVEEKPKAIHNYMGDSDPYREPIS